MTIIDKLNRLILTKKEIYDALAAKGIAISEDTPFKEVSAILAEETRVLPPLWTISDDGRKITLNRFPSTMMGCFSNPDANITTRFSLEGFGEPSSVKWHLIVDDVNKTDQSNYYCRNSIIGLESYTNTNGKVSSLFVTRNKKSSEEGKGENPLGYFLTGDNNEITGWIRHYDSSYEYKIDQMPENFLTYNAADNTMTLKAGTYESDPYSAKGESVIVVDEDKVMQGMEGSLAWFTEDYEYYVSVSTPSEEIYIGSYMSSRPQVEDYIRKQQIKTTSTGERVMVRASSSIYQWFTNDFVDISSNMYGSSWSFSKSTSSSASFAFNTIGDKYIFRTIVGDGFRNYIKDDYDYKCFLYPPTSLSGSAELHLLDGTVKVVEGGQEVDKNDLRRLDFMDIIYTVKDTSIPSYRNKSIELTPFYGALNKAFSQPIGLSTDYGRLSFDGIFTGYWFNVLPNSVFDGITTEPKYEVI